MILFISQKKMILFILNSTRETYRVIGSIHKFNNCDVYLFIVRCVVKKLQKLPNNELDSNENTKGALYCC